MSLLSKMSLQTGLWRLIPALLLLASSAQGAEILVLYNEKSQSHQGLLAELEKHPIFRSHRLTSTPDKQTATQQMAQGNISLLLSLGANNCSRDVLRLKPDVPHLCSLIPGLAYETQLRDNKSLANTSALFIDQPFDRLVRLAGLGLPNLKRAGIILSEETAALRNSFEQACRRAGVAAHVEMVQDSSEVADAVTRALEVSDVLITVPDRSVLNRNTARTFLLSAYLKRVPVIGYSRSYVRAGALLAPVSDIPRIATQLGDIIATAATHRWKLGPPVYPNQLDIAINRDVEKSLGLKLGDEEILAAKLMDAERR